MEEVVNFYEYLPDEASEARASRWGWDNWNRGPPRPPGAVLLMGPLYHLTERDDRFGDSRGAPGAAFGGVLFAAAIVRFASLLDALARASSTIRASPRFSRRTSDPAAPQPDRRPGLLHLGILHLPKSCGRSFWRTAFRRRVGGRRGPRLAGRQFRETLADPARRQHLLDLVRRVEREPALLGFSRIFWR